MADRLIACGRASGPGPVKVAGSALRLTQTMAVRGRPGDEKANSPFDSDAGELGATRRAVASGIVVTGSGFL